MPHFGCSSTKRGGLGPILSVALQKSPVRFMLTLRINKQSTCLHVDCLHVDCLHVIMLLWLILYYLQKY